MLNHAEETERPDRCPVCSTLVDPDCDSNEHAGQAVCPACSHLLWFMSVRKGDVTVVHLTDTKMAVLELLDLLENAVDDLDVGHLILDFRRIQQVSSAALGKLVKLKNHAEALRGKLKLCGLHEDLRQVFRITSLDRFFSIYDNSEEALASFAVTV